MSINVDTLLDVDGIETFANSYFWSDLFSVMIMINTIILTCFSLQTMNVQNISHIKSNCYKTLKNK